MMIEINKEIILFVIRKLFILFILNSDKNKYRVYSDKYVMYRQNYSNFRDSKTYQILKILIKKESNWIFKEMCFRRTERKITILSLNGLFFFIIRGSLRHHISCCIDSFL